MKDTGNKWLVYYLLGVKSKTQHVSIPRSAILHSNVRAIFYSRRLSIHPLSLHMLFALGENLYSLAEHTASIRCSRHRSCRTSKETERHKNAASEKCQNDIGSRNRMRRLGKEREKEKSRGRKSNAREERRRLLLCWKRL